MVLKIIETIWIHVDRVPRLWAALDLLPPKEKSTSPEQVPPNELQHTMRANYCCQLPVRGPDLVGAPTASALTIYGRGRALLFLLMATTRSFDVGGMDVAVDLGAVDHDVVGDIVDMMRAYTGIGLIPRP